MPDHLFNPLPPRHRRAQDRDYKAKATDFLRAISASTRQEVRSDAVGVMLPDRAMSAGPADVAKAARIVDTDAQGKMVVLREGNNGFTRMPGDLKVVGEPPMCVDAGIDAVVR